LHSNFEKLHPNAHVEEYLAYYANFTVPPRFAVLLAGKWGSGKTYQVNRILEGLMSQKRTESKQSSWLPSPLVKEPKKRFVLVSLYGLKSHQEIDEAMVAALYPWSNNDGYRIAASVGKAFLKHAKYELPKLKPADLFSKMSAEIFVFDDLERCNMKITDALGYMNQLVERDGCKVVILANEDEIRKGSQGPEYETGKEKLIGKTLEVEPDFDAAFFAFLNEIDDTDTRGFLSKLKPEIYSLYDQSELKNLRILQQTMWDFERVYKVIGQSYRDNHDAMHHLLRLFFVLCFEYKAGRLSKDDLQGRTSRSMVDIIRSEETPSPLRQAGEKYSGFYIYDSILSDEACAAILIRGIVEEHTITSSLNNSSWFVSENEPSWVTLWRSIERADADVEAAAKTMLTEFDARHYKKTGEVLHLFGQMLFLADLGVSGLDRAQTVSSCKVYVDDLKSADELEPPQEAYLDDIRHGSYGGLGFAQAETEEFRELRTYISNQRVQAEEDRYADQASNLMELMKTDTSAFWSQIAYHRDGSAQYANRPVLSQIDAETFANNMLTLEPPAFRDVCLGLDARYDMAKLAKGRELELERDWAEALQKALLDRAKTMGPFAQNRIAKNVEWTFGKRLSELSQPEPLEE
jgi:KAP family P-loop domain